MKKDWIIGDTKVFKHENIDRIETDYVEGGSYASFVYLKDSKIPSLLCTCNGREEFKNRLNEILN